MANECGPLVTYLEFEREDPKGKPLGTVHLPFVNPLAFFQYIVGNAEYYARYLSKYLEGAGESPHDPLEKLALNRFELKLLFCFSKAICVYCKINLFIYIYIGFSSTMMRFSRETNFATMQREKCKLFLTYLFRLCFNQCNASLHFGSSKHSHFKKKKQGRWPAFALGLGASFFASTLLHDIFNSAVYVCMFSLSLCRMVFPVGSTNIFQNRDFHSHYFHFSARPDGSRVLLARPHGTPHRVGTLQFRVIFLTFGRHRVPRTCIFSFLHTLDWNRLISTNARLFLFLTCFTSSAVTTPRIEPVPAPVSPVASIAESDSDLDSV